MWAPVSNCILKDVTIRFAHTACWQSQDYQINHYAKDIGMMRNQKNLQSATIITDVLSLI